MTAVEIRHIDTHRIDAVVNGQLAAYAIADQWGWALMAPRDGYIVTVQRVDFGTTARRNARVGQRLTELVAG